MGKGQNTLDAAGLEKSKMIAVSLRLKFLAHPSQMVHGQRWPLILGIRAVKIQQ